jgi:hypothetical protein
MDQSVIVDLRLDKVQIKCHNIIVEVRTEGLLSRFEPGDLTNMKYQRSLRDRNALYGTF